LPCRKRRGAIQIAGLLLVLAAILPSAGNASLLLHHDSPSVRSPVSSDVSRIEVLRVLTIPEHSRGMVSQCSVAFSPDGKLLVAACGKNRVPIWNVVTGEIVHLLYEEPIQAMACGFSPDGSLLATAGADDVISLWDPESGVLLGTVGEGLSFVWDLAFSEDGTRLISCSLHGSVVCWNLASGERIWSYASRRGYLSVDAGPERVVFGSLRDGVGLIDRDGELLRHWRDATDHVGDVSLCPDGSIVAAGCDDDRIYVWEAASDRLHRVLTGHAGYVNGVAFTPDGALLVSGSHDRTVGLWDVASGDFLRTLEGHDGVVLRVAVDPTGTWIASTSWDGTVRLWGVPPMEGEDS